MASSRNSENLSLSILGMTCAEIDSKISSQPRVGKTQVNNPTQSVKFYSILIRYNQQHFKSYTNLIAKMIVAFINLFKRLRQNDLQNINLQQNGK